MARGIRAPPLGNQLDSNYSYTPDEDEVAVDVSIMTVKVHNEMKLSIGVTTWVKGKKEYKFGLWRMTQEPNLTNS